MKRIYLMRHGKAEDGFDQPDFERNLVTKGQKKTKKVALYLAEKKIKPEQILASMATRTLQTANIVSSVLGVSNDLIKEEKNLYLASSNSILEAIYPIDDHINEILLIGHNPGISSLATYLCNEDIDWMSTSSVVAVELEISKWTDIANGKRKLIFYTKPSDI